MPWIRDCRIVKRFDSLKAMCSNGNNHSLIRYPSKKQFILAFNCSEKRKSLQIYNLVSFNGQTSIFMALDLDILTVNKLNNLTLACDKTCFLSCSISVC